MRINQESGFGEGKVAVSIDLKMGTFEMRSVIEEKAIKEPNSFGKNRKNILIVDDDETLLHLLKRYFIREGFDVVVAKDGIEAMEKMKSENPAIVLTDLNIPSLSGIEFIQYIQNNFKNISIIVMTAYPEDWNGSKVEAFFVKPFDIDEMVSAIQRIVRIEAV